MVGLNTPLPERTVIETIPVEVRRSARRRTRIGLAFDPAGFVIVEAPVDASTAEIHAVIREHQRWLRVRLDKVADGSGVTACLRYRSGELVHYLGEPYELIVRHGRFDDVRLLERPAPQQMGLFAPCHLRGTLRVTLAAPSGDEALVRSAVKAWYKTEAERTFARALGTWRYRLPWLDGQLPPWRHRLMRSQWGSCTRAGRVSLNTHLIKTPTRLIRYVVLHELCHLQHYDHSRRFYALLGRHMPDWQQRRSELDRFLPVLLQD